MVRKKIDSRIRVLVENCVAQRHRSLFVIVGDKGRDQVVNLHYMLSKTMVKARPSVLWCYKKELYLSRCERPGAPSARLRPFGRQCRCCISEHRRAVAARMLLLLHACMHASAASCKWQCWCNPFSASGARR